MHSLRAYSHGAKVNAKAKKIKEPAKEIKEKLQTSNKNFAFVFTFAQCEWVLRISMLKHPLFTFLDLTNFTENLNV